MAKIHKGKTDPSEVGKQTGRIKKTSREETSKSKQDTILMTEQEREELAQYLRAGEGIRADGRLIYRIPRSEYDGGEPISPLYARSLDELREKERALKERLARRLSAKDTKITVDELFDQWTELKKGLRDNTSQNYIYMYNLMVRGTKLGRTRASTVKKSDILAFYNNLVDVRHVQISSLETVQNVLHQMFTILTDDDILANNPANDALGQLKRSTKLGRRKARTALSVPEQYLFFNYLEKHPEEARWNRVFRILLGTGVRIAELSALRWIDVDFENNVIRIEHTLVYYPHHGQKPVCSYNLNDPKTPASQRQIPMLNFVREALLEEKEYQDKTGEHGEQIVNGMPYGPLVLFNRFNQALNQGTVNKAIRRIIRDCNQEIMIKSNEKDPILLPPFSCHTLRHTCATRLVESGKVAIIAISAFMGHSSVQTTMDIYVSCTENFKRKAFGLDKNKKYPNLFDEALKDITPTTNVTVNNSYTGNIGREDTSRMELSNFTQQYSDIVQKNANSL